MLQVNQVASETEFTQKMPQRLQIHVLNSNMYHKNYFFCVLHWVFQAEAPMAVTDHVKYDLCFYDNQVICSGWQGNFLEGQLP